MKNKQLCSLLPLFLILSACETRAESGALAGAGVGALAGGLIANSATGAVVGGALGAAAGGLAGYALDESDRRSMEEQSPETLDRIDHNQQLTLQDIKEMSAAGISDRVIINQIEATHSVFHLSSDDIIELKHAGVSQNVIDAMVNTGEK